jgi:hypothetical protein
VKEFIIKRSPAEQIVHEMVAYSYHIQAVHQVWTLDMKQGCVFCGLAFADIYENETFLRNI